MSGDVPFDFKPPGTVKHPARPPRFRIQRVTAILLLVAGLLGLVFLAQALVLTGLDSAATSRATGLLFGLAVWPLLLGWGSYRLSGRSVLTGNIVMSIMAVLVAISFGAMILGAEVARRRAPAEAAMRECEGLMAAAREAEGAGDFDRALSLAEQASAKMKQAADLGLRGAVAVAYSAEVTARRTALNRVYIEASTRFREAGGGSINGLTDSASVQARVDLLRAALDAHAAVLRHFETALDDARRDLAARGVSAENIDSFVRGADKGGRVGLVIKLHRLEQSLLESVREQLDLLLKHPGAWKGDPQGRLITLEGFPAEAVGRYNQLARQARTDSDEQARLRERIAQIK